MTTDNIPKSRLTLTYQMKVNGKPKDVELPFRMVILGDLSGKKGEERGELDQRKIRRLDGKNLSKVMETMNITTKLEVPNLIGHSDEAALPVTLKFKDMASFTPEAVSDQIPPVRALKLLKALLSEAQSNIDNSKSFRGLIRKLGDERETKSTTRDPLKTSLAAFAHFDIAALKAKAEKKPDDEAGKGDAPPRAAVVADQAQPAPVVPAQGQADPNVTTDTKKPGEQ